MTSFYIIIPSNTNIEGNRTNSFRVRLPHKLQFNSEWHVGLAVMVYPHSWPSLGTNNEQTVTVYWKSGMCEALVDKFRNVHIEYTNKLKELRTQAKDKYKRLKELYQKRTEPVSNVTTAEHVSISEETEVPSLKSEDEIFTDLMNIENLKMPDDFKRIISVTNEVGFDPWIRVFRKPRLACNFEFHSYKNRFSLHIDSEYVEKIELTEQLAYILGFDRQILTETCIANFMPDMRGGVSCFHVYAPGLIEPMVIGDVTAPVLRIVTIRGKQDEIIEEQFLCVQYHKLLVKEISEIFIEIRTSSGTLMPFQYGTCTLTLHFKKATYF
uniref:Uncharacterized protein n=1 Tax=Meloidogyne enterolobii TaxID=390850 RepID=A0A6V7YCG7_MELEN|nr:unnamed protein product [Meloidogyne enterolobii]